VAIVKPRSHALPVLRSFAFSCVRTNKKPTGHLLLAGGSESCLELDFALVQQVTSAQKTRLIRMDVLVVVVHTVIRVIWVIERIIGSNGLKL